MSKTSIEHASRIDVPDEPQRRTANGPTMGTRFSAVLYPRSETSIEAVQAALQETVDRVDRQMSTWNPWSDLNRLNDAPVGVWTELPSHLMTVLEISLDIERASGGAFDIGVGDLVAAWGFGARAASAPPPKHRRTSPRPRTRDVLELVNGRARKRAPLDLDLSGIAKGFAVDEMARVMHRFAVPAFLVGIDGEIRTRGTKPGGEPWTVAHEKPDRNVRAAMSVIELRDRAVATSGNYRHWREHDGRSYSHTMCARSDQPITSDLASATVIAPTCTSADAWATALLVLGVERGLTLARRYGLDAIFVRDDESVVSTF